MKTILEFDPVLIELGMHPSCDLALDAVVLALDVVVLECIVQDL